MTKKSSRARPARERFEALCIPEPTSGCLLWLGAIDRDGYGSFFDGEQTVRAHRFACEQVHGPLAPGVEALHSCDTPCCVAEAHLRPGTRLDNMGEAARKGRIAHGSHSGIAKLDERKVAIGRALGMSAVDFAKRFDVDAKTARWALSGVTWKHVRMLWDRRAA
ncbi:HNH endonuclease [Microvirga vignae]|uniref:HNH endonuclease n=1 Tax=Microvirga vignae TaxID=1225564 RepID=UPI000B1A4F1E|nr:HNH endonuclease [Microvirga vignae]